MKKFNFFKRPYGIFLILIVICGIVIGISAIGQSVSPPLKAIASVTIIPLQKGINKVGSWLFDGRSQNLSLDEALNENESLKRQVTELQAESQKHAADEDEIARLNSLLGLKDTYKNYNTVGATIIMKNSGSNWYRKFTIDKGSNDGLAVDMNVIATGGLVGIITDVGPNYSIVTSIIDESSNVSGMIRKSLETCIVAGDMASINNSGKIRLEYMSQNFNSAIDSTIVTSTISDKYVPGIVIGRAVDVTIGDNRVSKSGYLIPAVDFQTLKDVLVITTLKQTMSDEEVEQIKAELFEPETTVPAAASSEETSEPETTAQETETQTEMSGEN